ncbi:MAG: O-antigen ligase family protein [Pseudobdellovibrionaceae bacterium]|nr:O-antigen ligase family protein [Pseudobdellovibrionaceae bacterium]
MVLLFPLSLIPFLILCRMSFQYWYAALTAFAGAGIITAAGLLLTNWEQISDGVRLSGWGRGENPVLCGLLYGLVCLIMIFCRDNLYFYKKLKPQYQIALISLPFAILVFSKSRGPFAACVAAGIAAAILSAESVRKFFTKNTIYISSAIILSVGAFVYNGYSYFENRGTTGRSQIWEQAIDLFQDKPVLGHGIATKFIYLVKIDGHTYEVSHPHSVYLSALVHTGFAGLVLQIVTLLAGLYYAFIRLRCSKDSAPFIFLCVGAAMGFVDFGGYYTNLGITWIVFWFPMTLLSLPTYLTTSQFGKET